MTRQDKIEQLKMERDQMEIYRRKMWRNIYVSSQAMKIIIQITALIKGLEQAEADDWPWFGDN